MSYIKAEDVLPRDIIEIIQKYIDGKNVYIPKKSDSRSKWGSNTDTLSQLNERNQSIYNDYINGIKIKDLAEKYYLSEKSVQRIIYQIKNWANPDKHWFFVNKLFAVLYHFAKLLKSKSYNII